MSIVTRITRRIAFIGSITVLFLCFQNFTTEEIEREFSEVPSELLNPSLKTMKTLVAPTSGHDLESVMSSWAEQEKNSIVQGRDTELLKEWTEKLNSLIAQKNESKSDSDKNQKRAIASESYAESSQDSSPDSASQKRAPASLRFTKVNQIQYNLAPSSIASCDYDTRGANLNVSKDLGGAQLVFRHQVGQGAASLNFNMNF